MRAGRLAPDLDAFPQLDVRNQAAILIRTVWFFPALATVAGHPQLASRSTIH